MDTEKANTTLPLITGSGTMVKYAAFLRGINVGGRKIIRMDELNSFFISGGFTGVKTLIQSGNVVFFSEISDKASVRDKVEAMLLSSLGYPVKSFILSFEELNMISGSDPFKGILKSTKVKFYISLLYAEPSTGLKLPMFSAKKDLELFRIEGNIAYILSHEINGSFGFPNNFVEELTGMKATTRNWNTIEKLAKM